MAYLFEECPRLSFVESTRAADLGGLLRWGHATGDQYGAKGLFGGVGWSARSGEVPTGRRWMHIGGREG